MSINKVLLVMLVPIVSFFSLSAMAAVDSEAKVDLIQGVVTGLISGPFSGGFPLPYEDKIIYKSDGETVRGFDKSSVDARPLGGPLLEFELTLTCLSVFANEDGTSTSVTRWNVTESNSANVPAGTPGISQIHDNDAIGLPDIDFVLFGPSSPPEGEAPCSLEDAAHNIDPESPAISTIILDGKGYKTMDGRN